MERKTATITVPLFIFQFCTKPFATLRFASLLLTPQPKAGGGRKPIAFVVQYRYVHIAMFVEIFSGKHLDNAAKRAEADAKMRSRFEYFTAKGICGPKLYGLCAFGQRVCLYVYDRDSGRLEPSRPAKGKEPPVEWWSIDIMGELGQEDYFARVVEPIKQTENVFAEATVGLLPNQSEN